MNNKITLIANDKCWIEHTALSQLENIANLKNVEKIAGLPDLHAGKSPVGIVMKTRGTVYPHIVGNDIGCGIGLFQTNCKLKKYKQERFVQKLNHIRKLEDLITVNPYDDESPIHDLGTIGSGNHFVEFQAVDKVYDEAAFQTLGINKKQLQMLVHSGSRGYGAQILSEYPAYDGYKLGQRMCAEYIEKHNNALLWANRNRKLVAEKIMDYLGFSDEVTPVLDSSHNFISIENEYVFHYKGAVKNQGKMIAIPGSRGSLTYIVKPALDTSISLDGLSHGAGRKWARSLCKGRIKNKYDRNTIRHTELGSRVVCHDTDLLYQEAPEAYKNIRHIIDALVEHKLCTVVATLTPLVTYKGDSVY